MAADIPDLMKMTQAQLDDLFRQSPAGPIPNGEAQGTAIIAPGTELEGIAAKFIHLFAWQGKVFDAGSGELRNKILPMGLKAIIAKVYKGHELVRRQGVHRPGLFPDLADRGVSATNPPGRRRRLSRHRILGKG